MCQSEATPSSALYWHIGETTIRLGSSRSASRIGVNRALVMSHAARLDENGAGTIGNGVAGRQAWLRCLITLCGRALRHLGRGLSGRPGLLREDLVRGARRNLGPALGGADRLADALKEALLAVITLPAAGLVELDQVRPPALRQGTPFQRDLIECMLGMPVRHGEAVAGRKSRRVIVSSSGRSRNDRLSTGIGCARNTHRISCNIIVRFGTIKARRWRRRCNSRAAWRRRHIID